MGAFPAFHTQSPPFLAHQRDMAEHSARSNSPTLYGLTRIPSYNHIRRKLDGVEPEHFDERLIAIAYDLEKRGALRTLRRLGGLLPVALDGTQYFSSYKIGCAHCSTRRHANGEVGNHHAFLVAAVVTPGMKMALPLAPELTRPQDGTHFIFVYRPGNHRHPHDRLERCELQEMRRTVTTGNRKPVRHIHRYRWARDLPLRDGPGAMPVSRVGFEIINADTSKRSLRTAFVTDLPVNRHNVAEIVACDRARWRLENNGFNVMKSECGLEHSFGHGKETLSGVLLMLNLVAFAIHTGSDLLGKAWQELHRHRGFRRQMFELVRSTLCLMLFDSWDRLMVSLTTQAPWKPPQTRWRPLPQPLPNSILETDKDL